MILVTGSAGFIGRAVVAALQKRGHEVCGASVDLLDAAAAGRLVRSVHASHLVHLAWVTTPGEYWTSPLNRQWVGASERMFHEFADAGGTRIVSMGTCAEYDWLATGGVCDEETTPIAPATEYGRAKAELHDRLRALSLPYVWGRLFFPYGPHERDARLIPAAIRTLMRDEVVVIRNPGIRRDFLYVDDVGEAIATFVDGDATGAVNIGSGRAESIDCVAATIGELMQRPQLIRGEAGTGTEPPLVVAGTRRLSGLFGFHAGTSLTAGLLKTIDWWRRRELNA